jgi:hypothetical protein
LDAFTKGGKITIDAFGNNGKMGRNDASLDPARQSIGTLILNQNHSIDRSLEELDNLQY